MDRHTLYIWCRLLTQRHSLGFSLLSFYFVYVCISLILTKLSHFIELFVLHLLNQLLSLYLD